MRNVLILMLVIVSRSEMFASKGQTVHTYTYVDTVIFPNGQRVGRAFNAQAGAGVVIRKDVTADSFFVDTSVVVSSTVGQKYTDTVTWDATTWYVQRGTITLTNKRITKRVISRADAIFITPTADSADVVKQTNTQAAGTLTINAPTGTPTDGQEIEIVVKSTNQQTLSWNAIYTGGHSISLPTTTTGSSKYDRFYFEYSNDASKYRLINSKTGYQ